MSQSLILNGGLNLSLNLSSPGTNIPNMTAQLLDHIKVKHDSFFYKLNFFIRKHCDEKNEYLQF